MYSNMATPSWPTKTAEFAEDELSRKNNFGSSTIATVGGISAVATSFDIASAATDTAWRSDNFYIRMQDTADPPTKREIAFVGTRTGTTLSSIVRGKGGTTALSFDQNDIVEVIDPAEALEFLAEELKALEENPGCAASQVITSTSGPVAVGANEAWHRADATSGAFAYDLPTAVGRKGYQYIFQKVDSTSNAITLDPNGSETIDGVATRDLTTQFECVIIRSDGSNWVSIASIGDDTGLPTIFETATSVTLQPNKRHVANNGALTTLALPASAARGTVCEVVNMGSGGAKISQAAGQVIRFADTDGPGATTTGTSGFIQTSAQQRCSVELLCIVADTEWQVIDMHGTWSVN